MAVNGPTRQSTRKTTANGVELLKSADGAAFLTNTEDGELH
ncbi:hypothetical protein MJO28_012430 [Puccinia striiformis f. sp. tritici]|uniref:Uncharacterized protein n=2 Tax=Puccinia striiformis TaxID=27350 RepID=A0A2S4WFX4_9BASI|nr:hypothetical protein MJO28_012430 [Puccinia striiformis f. sp. tritici]KAI7945606.1 hypothetical protein MJO29_011994 [Puccinia striiformis f. sp. tritici]POW20607.1 hypothetical protein PSHT_03305 [Puccinia striiformis]